MPPWPSDRPNRGPGRARSEAGPSCPRSARPSLLCSAPPTRRRLRASSSARRSPWRVARLARDPHPTSRRRCRYVTSARRACTVCPEEGVGDWWRLRSFRWSLRRTTQLSVEPSARPSSVLCACVCGESVLSFSVGSRSYHLFRRRGRNPVRSIVNAAMPIAIPFVVTDGRDGPSAVGQGPVGAARRWSGSTRATRG